MNITIGQIISIILFLTALTTLLLNLRKISKWLSNIVKYFAQKDKKRIAELEKNHSGEIDKINKQHLEEIAKFQNTISALEAKTCNLERQTQIMDVIPEGCELLHNNVLLDKKTNIKYCWNCWNKINGRERRVLEGNEYAVSCKVCQVHTRLREHPRQEPPKRYY